VSTRSQASRFSGKAALVTGGASGIGLATARQLADEGARVTIGDVNAEACAAAADELGVAWVKADVASGQEVEAMVDEAAKGGRLDILVNAAGTIVGGSAMTTTEDDWDRVLGVNLRGPWLCSKQAVPYMAAGGAGAIVNIASTGGLVGLSDLAAYCAAKGGLISLTRSMAIDCAPLGVRVNAVCPGQIRTPMADRFLADKDDPDAFIAEFVSLHPLGRMGEPEEIAASICFLASDDAAFLTGVAMPTDGGYTAQ
jgi:NAD(P)-dependent dehydrogenase (short-subunit alcohol dehydrogenase family)